MKGMADNLGVLIIGIGGDPTRQVSGEKLPHIFKAQILLGITSDSDKIFEVWKKILKAQKKTRRLGYILSKTLRLMVVKMAKIFHLSKYDNIFYEKLCFANFDDKKCVIFSRL